MPLVLIFFGQLTWSLNVFCFMSLDCLWFCQKHAFASTPLQILRVWSVYATEGYALGIDSVKSLCLWCSCQMNFLMGTIELCPRMKDRPDERPPLFQGHFWLLVTFFPSNFDVNKLLTKHHPSVQTTTFFFLLFFVVVLPRSIPLSSPPFIFLYFYCGGVAKEGYHSILSPVLQTACDCSKQIVYLIMPPRRRATCFIC